MWSQLKSVETKKQWPEVSLVEYWKTWVYKNDKNSVVKQAIKLLNQYILMETSKSIR